MLLSVPLWAAAVESILKALSCGHMKVRCWETFTHIRATTKMAINAFVYRNVFIVSINLVTAKLFMIVRLKVVVCRCKRFHAKSGGFCLHCLKRKVPAKRFKVLITLPFFPILRLFLPGAVAR